MEPTTHRPSRLRLLMPIWLGLVILFFAWQTIRFAGLPARAVSWEYDRFGMSLPSATLLLLIALFAAPALFLLFSGRGSEGRRGRVLMLTLAALAGGCLIAAIGSGAAAWFGGRSVGETQTIVLDGRPLPAIDGGPTRLDGEVRRDRIAEHKISLLLTTRIVRYAPVVAPGRRGGELQFFVALDGKVRDQGTARLTGVLRGSLPGEITQLYERAGYRVARPHYVLYPDPADYRWPFIVLAIKLSLAALLLGIAAAVERRRLRARG